MHAGPYIVEIKGQPVTLCDTECEAIRSRGGQWKVGVR